MKISGNSPFFKTNLHILPTPFYGKNPKNPPLENFENSTPPHPSPLPAPSIYKGGGGFNSELHNIALNFFSNFDLILYLNWKSEPHFLPF